MTEPPRLEWIEDRLRRVFGSDRMGPVVAFGWSCRFTLSTATGARLTGEELRRVSLELDVRPMDIEVLPSVEGEGFDLYLALDQDTPIETTPPTPRGKR